MARRRVAKGPVARERRYRHAVIRQIRLVDGSLYRRNPLVYRYVDPEEMLRKGDTLDRFKREAFSA